MQPGRAIPPGGGIWGVYGATLAGLLAVWRVFTMGIPCRRPGFSLYALRPAAGISAAGNVRPRRPAFGA